MINRICKMSLFVILSLAEIIMNLLLKIESLVVSVALIIIVGCIILAILNKMWMHVGILCMYIIMGIVILAVTTGILIMIVRGKELLKSL